MKKMRPPPTKMCLEIANLERVNSEHTPLWCIKNGIATRVTRKSTVTVKHLFYFESIERIATCTNES
jgi:hypothetical protein